MKMNLFLTVIFILLQIMFGCKDNIIGPEKIEQEFKGQVVSDYVNAVLKTDSTVWTWGGNNFFGTLGNGTRINSDFPVKVLNLKSIVGIDLSFGAAFAADAEGNIWFWGNYWTYLGPPNIDTAVTVPVKIAILKDVISISVFNLYVQLLTKSGSVWYIKMDPYSPKTAEGPTQYAGIENIVAIHKFCALRADGKIYNLPNKEWFVSVPENITMVQSTQFRTVVLDKDGIIWSWGKNELGQLGNGTFNDSEIIMKVNNFSDIIAISSNFEFNLALKKDGTVWFWGFAGFREGSPYGLNTPFKIEGLEKIKLIYVGMECLVMDEAGTYWNFSYDKRIPKQVQFN